MKKIIYDLRKYWQAYFGFLLMAILYAMLLFVSTSCVPNVTYKGKYGTYTATPSGVVIHPYYAITDDK